MFSFSIEFILLWKNLTWPVRSFLNFSSIIDRSQLTGATEGRRIFLMKIHHIYRHQIVWIFRLPPATTISFFLKWQQSLAQEALFALSGLDDDGTKPVIAKLTASIWYSSYARCIRSKDNMIILTVLNISKRGIFAEAGIKLSSLYVSEQNNLVGSRMNATSLAFCNSYYSVEWWKTFTSD